MSRRTQARGLPSHHVHLTLCVLSCYTAHAGLALGSCLSDRDCVLPGSPLCSMALATTRCTCSNGLDACAQVGR